MSDHLDRDRLRQTFSKLSDDAGRVFDKLDDRRLSNALVDSCFKAGDLAHTAGDHVAAWEFWKILNSLLK